jgi:chemotaxis receptor (MCP) glutamine deamidase CheD
MSETVVKLTGFSIENSGTLVINQIGAGVGVILFDSKNKIGAGLHILAPDSRVIKVKNPIMYANTAIPYVLDQLRQKGVNASLSVAIAGGAGMLGKPGVTNVGPKNVQATKAALQKAGLSIKLDKTQGSEIRTIILNIDAGKIKIT